MKQYVLQNKKTGDLFIGAKVRFCDAGIYTHTNKKIETVYAYKESGSGWTVSLEPIDHFDGWILEHPQFAGIAPFFSRNCEKLFEVLGEL